MPASEGAENPALKPESSKEVKANSKTLNGAVKRDIEGEKLSGAELKKRAKAEKAARREQERQQKGGGGQINGQPLTNQIKTFEGAKEKGQPVKAGPKATTQSTKDAGNIHHKRSGSTAGELQRTSQVPDTAPMEKKQVALFGHLYGQSRRTTVAGAGKELHPAVLALGLQMSNYIICGSNARCVATLLVFKRVIESYTTPPNNTLTRHLTPHHLSPQIDYLKSCRPLSVSMGNAIRWLKLEISKVDPDTPEAEAKEQLCDAIDNFIRERITVADQVISSSAGEKIKSGDVVLTFASSSIVQQTLVEAHQRGVKFRVIVIDSKPLFEGKHLARSLANLGLVVQYSLIHAVSHAIRDATKVFLGAHAMMSNGRLYSRVGTAIIAMTAKEADVPVIICCESIKFTEKVALDSIVNNEVAPPDELVSSRSLSTSSLNRPGSGDVSSPLRRWREVPNLQLLNLLYDVTPAEYINMVITEYGSLPPSSVPVVYRLSTNT
ncbi:MAG: hypothetical protein M1827_001419 [Pycnora praestabilis]|nr:MAG: hypothetical protein M1827_001419 [Pycnora praestabilis]